DAWIDPLTRGSVLHALYARFGRDLRARGGRLDPRRDGARLRALGEAELQTLRATRPPPSDHVFARERAAFLRDLNLFLTLEAEDRGRTPIGFEVTFGSDGDEDEPLARAEPAMMDLGRGLRLRLRGR